eukprot:CAMPEP_0183320390 /NCGR_PEP_ID=MMETSP0160_2-20130417/66147_1 /TAXON_ID=2839 ORGANISM="Odontella Sinensis, Strain Grunow 1884" /NCGR_SAMPLE_ID=MMETSP0160_2 /ASSEMBLY_ACC=CAM_ASM_000250 /LENGTH=333 /DNA_ID=CAMNT_0025487077 /DNA_START=15 /DNA_END=1016 /DNA_ORIENTATION=+
MEYCDCDHAGAEGKKYAGVSCQHASTSACMEAGNPYLEFCVNGGECAEIDGTAGHVGCICPDGYSGPKCEFHKSEPSYHTDPTQCKLQCFNGGKCTKGVKGTGIDQGKMNQSFDHLPALATGHIDFEHCSCPKGYGGVDCSLRMEFCGKGEGVCLHGAKCTKFLSQEGEESWVWRCDCNGMTDEFGDVVAGRYCEYSATEYCQGGYEESFCTNGGKCLGKGSVNGHSGCSCPEGWTGDHCEYEAQHLTSFDGKGAPTVDGEEIGIIVSTSVMFGSFILLITAYLVIRIRRQMCGIETVVDGSHQPELPNAPSRSTFQHHQYSIDENANLRELL